MKPGSRELAIELVRIFARAGADRLGDPAVQRLLASSQFFSKYASDIETTAKDIDNQLSPDGARNRKHGSRKFYPLPFSSNGKVDLVLFRPTFTNEWDGCKMDVVQIGARQPVAAGGNSVEIGYRIERGKNDLNNPHRFLHLQPTNSFDEDKILLNAPKGLVFGMPSFPVNDSIMFAPIYACLIAYVGISPDWKKGLLEQLRRHSDHAGAYNFDQLQNSVKTTLHALLFQRGDKHKLSSNIEKIIYRYQHKLNMYVARFCRIH